MKQLLLLLLFSTMSFSQAIGGTYEFHFRENRTPDGWDKVETSGKVVFYEDRKTNTVTIITPDLEELLYVKSRQLFIRQDTFLYTLVDDDYKECSFRIIVNGTLETLEFYYYSDRAEEKYYKLNLMKCEDYTASVE